MTISRTIRKQSTHNARDNHLISLAADDVNYWTSFISDPLAVVFFLFWESTILRSNTLALSITYGAGLLSWSLLEYVAHRWIYHKGRSPAHVGHEMHHESPKMLIAMPWFVVTTLLGCVWVCAYWLQIHFILSFMAGLTTGFVFYGAFHHVHHHFHIKNSWYRKLRSHHVIHHQFPDVNFGVTSRLWDHVFGTVYQKELKKRVPVGGRHMIVEETRTP